MRPDPTPRPDRAHVHAHAEARGTLPRRPGRALRIGIGGPVGSGKTALVAALCRTLAPELSLAVVTNDIYTTEDADFLLRNGVLAAERVRAVETGACPHTAIRDDISANLEAVEELEATLPPLDLVLLESGGDNLTATFSRGLVHHQIFVIDVAGGDKVPRKGGPGSPRPTCWSSTRPIWRRRSARTSPSWTVTPAPSAATCRCCSRRWSGTRPRPTSPRGYGSASPYPPGDPVMRAHARLAVTADRDGSGGTRTRISRLRSEAPLIWRPTIPSAVEPAGRWNPPGAAHVALAAAAAGPVGGDHLRLDVEVAAGAALVVRGVAATLVLPGPHGRPSHTETRLRVAPAARWSGCPNR